MPQNIFPDGEVKMPQCQSHSPVGSQRSSGFNGNGAVTPAPSLTMEPGIEPIEPKSSSVAAISSKMAESPMGDISSTKAGVEAEDPVDDAVVNQLNLEPTKGNSDSVVGPGTASASSVMSHAGGEDIQPLQAVLVFAAVAAPNVLLVVCLSSVGFGMDLFTAFADRTFSMMGDACISGAALLAMILVVNDWWFWNRFVRVATGSIPLVGFVLGSLLKVRKYPWGPIIVVISSMPVLLGVLRIKICKKVKNRSFYKLISISASLCAVLVGIAWIAYMMLDDMVWTNEAQYRLIAKSQPVYDNAYSARALQYDADCGPDKDLSQYASADVTKIKKACSQAGSVWLLVYMCPLLTAVCDVILATFCYATGVAGSMNTASDIQSFLSRFMLVICFLLSGMYATATMSATSIRLGSTVLGFFLAAIILELAWVYIELDLKLVAEAANKSKLVRQMQKFWKSEWVKAGTLGAAAIPLLVFIVFNRLQQQLRILRGGADDPNERFTPAARTMVRQLASWKWTSILLKLCLLAELFFTMQVGVSKATYVFLSWLNFDVLYDESLTTVVMLVYVIGMSMFLLPPVPGLPVYVFAGILIAEKARHTEGVGFWLGVLIACVLGLFTKLCACTGQYMIGYFLGKSVKVQQLIGVDQEFTRAIEEVLKRKGLDRGKVAVLVGGPDWPTSVTCGIVGVNIPQMLLGTLPVVVLLAPCVVAGASLARVSPGEEGMWSMTANGAVAISAVVNMSSFAYAFYTVGQVIQDKGEELAKPREEHRAVAELTRKETAIREAYASASDWNHLSPCAKSVILTMTVSMVVANMAFTSMGESCFRPFAVSSRIQDPYENDGLNDGSGGDVLNIIIDPTGDPKGIGSPMLMLFAFGCCMHISFEWFMGRKAKALHKKNLAASQTNKPTQQEADHDRSVE